MTPGLRKLALTTHVTCSVGWLGAVAAFLALAVAGLATRDAALVRATSLAMGVMGWYVILPLSVASLLSGLLQSLGSAWGLVRHYWVVAKLLINLTATGVLLMYTRTLDYLSARAADPAVTEAELLSTRDPSPVLHSGVALVLLVLATVLAVYKPRGLTRYGRRRLPSRRTSTSPAV